MEEKKSAEKQEKKEDMLQSTEKEPLNIPPSDNKTEAPVIKSEEKSIVPSEEKPIKNESSESGLKEKQETKKEDTPQWDVFTIADGSQFNKLALEISQKISSDEYTIGSIIQDLFEEISDTCMNNFNFSNHRIPFERYIGFFKEVNRAVPKLNKKITSSDCFSTVFYIGDSHGSIEDMYTTISFFRKIVQKDPKVKFIFVGDYVDRNPWDLPNLVYVVGFALLYPKNVILLRGNHEDRTVNTYYGFVDNLLRYFWDQGNDMYEEIIKFFQKLPIANISQIFSPQNTSPARVLTVHGGIPVDLFNFSTPIKLDEAESKMVVEVDKSEDMDPLTVAMLWADPDEMINSIVTDDQGSGRLRFGEPIFNAFMQINNLHLLVRGHQKWNEGYKIFFHDRLYSIFSTSKYDDRKKFNPKILHLQYGKSPAIYDIEEKTLNAVLETYTA